MFDLSITNVQIKPERLIRTAARDRLVIPDSVQLVELRESQEIRIEERDGLRAPNVLHIPLAVPQSGTDGLTRMETAYLRWLDSGRFVFPSILAVGQSGPLVFRCEQGIDRTGFVCAMLHLLLGTPEHSVVNEYMAMGDAFTNAHHIFLCLDKLRARGGIRAYLLSCGVPHSRMLSFRSTILCEPY